MQCVVKISRRLDVSEHGSRLEEQERGLAAVAKGQEHDRNRNRQERAGARQDKQAGHLSRRAHLLCASLQLTQMLLRPSFAHAVRDPGTSYRKRESLDLAI